MKPDIQKMTEYGEYECPHGLDLRLHPRCYMCEPWMRDAVNFMGGCACPTVWHAIIPPPCPVHNPTPPGTVVTTSGSTSA